MPAPLALIFLSVLPWPFGGSQGDVTHIGAWTLAVRRDPFAERVHCRLTRPKIEYQRQALTFHLSAHADTSDAVYRVDDGGPIRTRDDAFALARLGFALHADDLNNPSGGLVRVPQARLDVARAIRIEAGANAKPVKFDLQGFSAALDAAKKAGCAADSFE
jgi:hypothetical protein